MDTNNSSATEKQSQFYRPAALVVKQVHSSGRATTSDFEIKKLTLTRPYPRAPNSFEHFNLQLEVVRRSDTHPSRCKNQILR